MKLSSDKLFFSLKKACLLVFCVLIIDKVNADAPIYNRTPLDETTIPANFPGTNKTYNQVPNSNYESNAITSIDLSQVELNNGVITPIEGTVYSNVTLETYYNQQVLIYGNLGNTTIDNYVYSDGRKDKDIYNGILSHIIRDFDRDGLEEMAIFRIRTDGLGELANKEIVLDFVRVLNGVPAITESLVISQEIFEGEEIECSTGIKYVNDSWRIYLNYFAHQVLENYYTSKFIAVECLSNLNIISEINYTGSGDEVDIEDGYNFQNQIMDSGLVIKEDANIFTRGFLNDDVDVTPVFTIKRVNEKMREGFMDDYLNTHFDEMSQNGFIKVRYGYTTFIDRAR